MSRITKRLLLIGTLVCALPSAAQVAPVVDPSAPAVPLTDTRTPQQKVAAWLDCDDCNAHELAIVKDLGEAAVPILARAYNGDNDLLGIPALRTGLSDRYTLLEAHAEERGLSLDLDRTEYLEYHVNARLTNARHRAERALRLINTPSALAVLRP